MKRGRWLLAAGLALLVLVGVPAAGVMTSMGQSFVAAPPAAAAPTLHASNPGRLSVAVVIGATAAVAGLDGAQTARLIGFEEVQTVIAAAVKLQPFDPAVAVAWAVAAGHQVEAMVSRVGALTDVDEIPAYAAPQIGCGGPGPRPRSGDRHFRSTARSPAHGAGRQRATVVS